MKSVIQRYDKNKRKSHQIIKNESKTTASNTRSHQIESLHQAIGNHGVQKLAKGGTQPFLKVSNPGDSREREADRVAKAFSQNRISTPSNNDRWTSSIQRRKTDVQFNKSSESPLGAGQPLPADVKSLFESRFEDDFSNVRIHTGSRGDKAAQTINAKAFTTGEDIGFRAGEYTPQTNSGKQLIAHELAHVVQQRSRAEDVVFRKVASYTDAKDQLTYGIFDWIITDDDAREVLAYLSGLSDDELLWTIVRMKRDGLLARLLDNVPDADRTTYDAVLEKIQAQVTREAEFTEESKQTLRMIHNRLESGKALSGLLTAAPFISVSTFDPVNAYLFFTTDWDDYVRAIESVPVIVKSRIQQDIQFLLLTTDLPQSEKRFWTKMLELWSH